MLTSAGLCGAGCEPVPLSAFTAIALAKSSDYEKTRPPVPCVAFQCPVVPPDEINIPNYYASCESDRCVALDVRTSPLSACTDSSQCYLRSGTTCCGCGTANLVAVSKAADVEQAFCAGSGGCSEDCTVGPAPADIFAFCSAGHCIVHYPAAEGGAP